MKTLFLYIGFVFFLVKIDVQSVRQDYKNAVKSKEIAVLLNKKLAKVTKGNNKTLVAYKGATLTLLSKQQKAIKNKKPFFKNGVSLIEYAIKKEPNNIEIRFIRLSIQQNIPKFLKYNKHITEDKKFVLSKLKSIKSTSLKKYILDYINYSKHFSETEKSQVN